MGNSWYNPQSDKDAEFTTTLEGKSKQRKEKSDIKKAGSIKELDETQDGISNEKATRSNTKDAIVISKAAFVLSKKTKFTDDYELKETLGEGAFGVVGKCK